MLIVFVTNNYPFLETTC